MKIVSLSVLQSKDVLTKYIHGFLFRLEYIRPAAAGQHFLKISLTVD